MTDATKLCSKCELTKSIAEFSPRGGSRKGRQAWCKTCLSDYTAERQARQVRERRGLSDDHPRGIYGGRRHPEGHTFVHRGYVLVKQSGHPRADRHGWVFQHIVIAEEKYGFPITRDFTVHHVNGNRSDNRPENLELRWGNHGKGADVLPGLLRNPAMRAVARRILSQYDEIDGEDKLKAAAEAVAALPVNPILRALEQRYLKQNG